MKYMGKDFKGFGTVEFDRAAYSGEAYFIDGYEFNNKEASPGGLYSLDIYAYKMNGKCYLDVLANYRNHDGNGFNHVAYVAEFDDRKEANQHFKRLVSAIKK